MSSGIIYRVFEKDLEEFINGGGVFGPSSNYNGKLKVIEITENEIKEMQTLAKNLSEKKLKKCLHPEDKRHILRGGYAWGWVLWRCLECGEEVEESDSEND